METPIMGHLSFNSRVQSNDGTSPGLCVAGIQAAFPSELAMLEPLNQGALLMEKRSCNKRACRSINC